MQAVNKVCVRQWEIELDPEIDKSIALLRRSAEDKDFVYILQKRDIKTCVLLPVCGPCHVDMSVSAGNFSGFSCDICPLRLQAMEAVTWIQPPSLKRHLSHYFGPMGAQHSRRK